MTGGPELRAFWGHSSAVAAGDGWLGPRERHVQAGLRFAKRRDDWRLGRFVAKRAVREVLGDAVDLPPHDIEILAAGDGAPQVFVGGAEPFAISLSHSGGIGFCVVGPAGSAPGCDVERIEPRDRALVRDHFTAAEAEWLSRFEAEERDRIVTIVWSAKESALKALRLGMRRDTRSVEVVRLEPALEGAWGGVSVECRESGRTFGGGWAVLDGHVLTVAGAARAPQRVA